MKSCKEISGDDNLTPVQILKYFKQNIRRNFFSKGYCPKVNFFPIDSSLVTECSSPSRLLAERHFRQFLPTVMPVGEVRVLEIGCGSGRLCRVLSDMGYTGHYVGLDVVDRFGISEIPGFNTRLVVGDAHNFEVANEEFDLIMSMSALEHIADDKKLIERLSVTLMAKKGIELHYLPSGWGLPLYLLHGYRQYPLKQLQRLFGGCNVSITGLGGFFSFLLHFLVITTGEMLLRIPFRKQFPKIYIKLLKVCLTADQFLMFASAIFVVFKKHTSKTRAD